MSRFAKRPPRIQVFQDMKPFFLINFNTFERQPLLATSAVHEAFLSFCHTAYGKYNVAVGRYVLMPEHIHFFVVMPQDVSLADWVGTLKNFLGKSIEKESPEKPVWQRGF